MTDTEQDMTVACVELIRRTGADSVQIRWSDDEEPTVWFAVAQYDDEDAWETAAARSPVEALLRLCELLVDGTGTCTHCGRSTVLLRSHDEQPLPLPFNACAYQYDPELKTFRRSCEGSNR